MTLSRAHRATPFVVQGTVRVPGDKSISHRALILGAMARGKSEVRHILQSADVQSTARVLRALGVRIPELSPAFVVESDGVQALRSPGVTLDCGNSGTTARLITGLVAGCNGVTARLDGDDSLRRRPMRRVADPLRQMGAKIAFESDGRLPMTVEGVDLHSIDYTSAQASAQVKSALLLAALASRVGITVREPFQSRDHTERMLAARGVSLEVLHDGVELEAEQEVLAADVEVPADPSSAAFLAGLAALADSGTISLESVCLNPTRTGFFELLSRMGTKVEVVKPRVSGGETVGTIHVSPGSLSCVTVRGADIPCAIDELPLLACVAARAEGETRILDAAELRVKESDRIGAVVSNLRAIGADAEELPDGLVVRGSGNAFHGRVTTHGDHRLAMAFGVLAACPENEIEIDDRACVAVSYPAFWTDIESVVSRAMPAGDGATTHRASQRFVIAIDGPAASGKSSTAKWVAERLGVRHVDSGALYRALTALALERTQDAEQWTEQLVLAGAPRVSLQHTRTSVVPVIDGTNKDDELRSSRVTRHVSRVAQMAGVREWVNERVREAASLSDVVVDGRDIGTAVFPNASLKVFLIADPWERARRRLLQRLGRLPVDEEIAEETERLVARDALDATQSTPARDAITIDTTRLTQEEQVDRIVTLAKAALKGG